MFGFPIHSLAAPQAVEVQLQAQVQQHTRHGGLEQRLRRTRRTSLLIIPCLNARRDVWWDVQITLFLMFHERPR